MVGPNVNWKLYDCIVEEINQNDDYPALIDIRSCNLHVVCGAFRSGVQKTKWQIDGALKAMHKFPAKGEDHQNITGLKVLPLPFCGNRWIEEKKVADRALDV